MRSLIDLFDVFCSIETGLSSGSTVGLPWAPPVFDAAKRTRGLDWPLRAHSMIGKLRMDQLRRAVEQVLHSNVPGDLIETGAWRVFGTLQGGFIHFNTSNNGPVTGFVGSVGSVTDFGTMGVFYPGVGVEAFAGPIGLRVDVGDEMYFNNGAQNNLRVAIGPQIRF